MKKSNEKTLAEVKAALEEIHSRLDGEELVKPLTDVLEDEQEAFDAKSDKWKEGEKGEEAQGALNDMQAAIDALEQATQYVSEALDAVNSVLGET